MKSFNHQSKRVAADNASRSVGGARKPSQLATSNEQQARDELTKAQTYQILPQIKLGDGITSEVHLCFHRPTSQLCAVKTISKSRIRRKDRIRREIALLREVKHRNIIRFYDAYEDEGDFHIITELCRGGELLDKIIEKSNSVEAHEGLNENGCCGSQQQLVLPTHHTCFREKDAARIIRSLILAISYLHSRDIIHRDIKPENVLFTEKGNDESPVKLIDFGFAVRHTRQCQPLTKTTGTLSYVAPEVLNGSYSRSCDLWSVGVVTYVMLGGRQPFRASTPDAIKDKIKCGQYEMDSSSFWNDGVSSLAKDFIQRLLDIDPQRRWTADMALGHDWLNLARVDA